MTIPCKQNKTVHLALLVPEVLGWEYVCHESAENHQKKWTMAYWSQNLNQMIHQDGPVAMLAVV